MKENTSMQTGMLNYQVSERSVQVSTWRTNIWKAMGFEIFAAVRSQKKPETQPCSLSHKSPELTKLYRQHTASSPQWHNGTRSRRDTLTPRQYLHPNIVPKAASGPWYNTQWLHKTITTWHGHSHGGRWLNIALLCTYMRRIHEFCGPIKNKGPVPLRQKVCNGPKITVL